MLTSKIKFVLIVALLFCGLELSFGQNTAKEQEAKLIAVLKSTAEQYEKAEACRELAHVGSQDAVPVLAALLADEKLSHMARYGLETIPSPAVDDALRDALGKLKGCPLVGVIGSIGVRHDAKATEALIKFLNDSDADVVQATARALGKIGTVDAAKGLEGALAGASAANKLAFYEGLFRCAEALTDKGKRDNAIAIYDSIRNMPQLPHQVLTGAWRGAILSRQKKGLPLLLDAVRSDNYGLALAAARIAVEMKVSKVSKALADELLGKVSVDKQILLAQVLGKRGDPVALPALTNLLKTGEKTVRLAAIKAMTEIGDASVVPTFIELLKDPDSDIAQTAFSCLAALPGADVDKTVVKMMESQDQDLRLKMIDLAGQRRIAKAMPAILKDMSDKDASVRLAAIKSCGESAGVAELPALLETLLKANDPGEISAFERVLGSVCSLANDREACARQIVESLSKSGPAVKPVLLRALGVCGGQVALQTVKAAVTDADQSIHSPAIRVLGEWKTAEAIPVLLDLAKNLGNANEKLLSLRGYLGMAIRRDIPVQDRLAICKESSTLIQRDEEKRMMLGALGSIASAESLTLIIPCLDNQGTRGEAISTVLAIAEKRERGQHVALTREALQKVVSVASDTDGAKKAQGLLKKMEGEK